MPLIQLRAEFPARQIVTDPVELITFEVDAGGSPGIALRDAIARIRESPFIPHSDKVRGFVYEVETGVLREVAQATA